MKTASANLASLTGTEKQVAWAESIRAEYRARIIDLNSIGNLNHELVRRGYKAADMPALGITSRESFDEFCTKILDAATSETSAAAWINEKQNGGGPLALWARELDRLAPEKI